MSAVNYTDVKDSGTRESFQTGSKRDSREGKGRFDLISPIAQERLAKHYENGARKYEDRNWERGQPLSRFMDSTMRHLNRFLEGHRDEDHLAAAMWNVAAMIHVEEMVGRGGLGKELLDLPSYLKEDKSSGITYWMRNNLAFWRWDGHRMYVRTADDKTWEQSIYDTPEHMLEAEPQAVLAINPEVL